MRIGVNTLFLVPGDVGGTETFLRQTLQALAEFHPGCSLVLFTTKDNYQTLFEDLGHYSHVEFIRLNFSARNRPLRIVLEQLLLPLAVARAKLDALWSPGYTAPFWVPCPQVVTIPDLQYKSFPEDLPRHERFVLDVLVRMACLRCDTVVTISEFSRQEVLRFGFAKPDKVRAVLLGVDASFGEPFSEEELQETVSRYVPGEKPYILCVAHTYPHKNVDLLVDAFVMIADRINHSLVIVGRPRRGEPKLITAENRLQEKERYIRLSSGVPFRDLQKLYHGASLFVLPSAYEGFGLPVLEAMMSGTPVVTTKAGSLPEIGGDNVIYVDTISNDAIALQILQLVMMDDGKLKQMISAARQRASGFTWQQSAQGMFQIFLSIMKNPPRDATERE